MLHKHILRATRGAGEEDANVDAEDGDENSEEGNRRKLGHETYADKHAQEEDNENTRAVHAEIIVGIGQVIHWLKDGRHWHHVVLYNTQYT
jgi:hypothetical protein